MMHFRPAKERGHANHGWLDTYHSFSFADYYDPRHMGFRSLRVINEDRVAASAGFPTHPHRDMEIITYVLEGTLQHRDSMGNGSLIRPGDVQRMSAGTGVTHSEFNASETDPVHFLQIWILPERAGIEPSYEQTFFDPSEKRGRLRLVASREGSEGSVRVHQDLKLFAGLFDAGEAADYPLAEGRHAWLQVAKGRVAVNGKELEAGDGVAIGNESQLRIEGRQQGEVLLFDMA